MKYSTVVAALVGVAAAAPGARLEQRVNNAVSRNPAARMKASGINKKIGEPQETDNKNVQYSGNWAGAVDIGSGYTQVEGVITVPEVSGSSNAAASAWVGIDGDTCQSAILQTGVSFYADGSFDAWYEWIPDYAYSFSGFGLSVGDQIKMVVDATSKQTGVASLENLSTGQKVSHTFRNTPSTLCETNAEWIVEAFQSGGSQVNLADFGTVTFTDATANNGAVQAGSGQIIDMTPNGQTVKTDCSASGSTVTCKYIN